MGDLPEQVSLSLRLVLSWMDIRNKLAPHYTSNDLAHQIDHADAVAYQAMDLFNFYFNQEQSVILTVEGNKYIWQTEDLKELMLLCCYVHDMFCDERRNHHELARDYILTTDEWNHVYLMNDSIARRMAAYAVLEHRSSWKEGYSSIFSELLAMADRGAPDPYVLVERSRKYAESRLKKAEIESLRHAIVHITEKFCIENRLPESYAKVYKQRLAHCRKVLLPMYQQWRDIPECLIGADTEVVSKARKLATLYYTALPLE